jgi:hypothetical protein
MTLERLPNDDWVEMESVVAVITDHHLDAKPVFALAIVRLSTGDEVGVRFPTRRDAIEWAAEFVEKVNACKEGRRWARTAERARP